MAVGGIIKKCEIIKKYWISILCGGMSPCAFFSFFYVLFCKAVFPCSFQKVFQQLGIEIFHLWMKDKNVTALCSSMICNAQHCRIGAKLQHNALCPFPLGFCSSSLVAVVNHVLSTVIVAVYLRCIDELRSIFSCRWTSYSQSIVWVHEYEFFTEASCKSLLMPTFPCQSLLSH